MNVNKEKHYVTGRQIVSDGHRGGRNRNGKDRNGTPKLVYGIIALFVGAMVINNTNIVENIKNGLEYISEEINKPFSEDTKENDTEDKAPFMDRIIRNRKDRTLGYIYKITKSNEDFLVERVNEYEQDQPFEKVDVMNDDVLRSHKDYIKKTMNTKYADENTVYYFIVYNPNNESDSKVYKVFNKAYLTEYYNSTKEYLSMNDKYNVTVENASTLPELMNATLLPTENIDSLGKLFTESVAMPYEKG